jgi:hypothetical protein
LAKADENCHPHVVVGRTRAKQRNHAPGEDDVQNGRRQQQKIDRSVARATHKLLVHVAEIGRNFHEKQPPEADAAKSGDWNAHNVQKRKAARVEHRFISVASLAV